MRLAVALLLAIQCVHAQSVKPYLRIETGAHASRVDRIDVDAAQRFLVSASYDKTARVWDLRNGNLLKILRPPIGAFQEGKLYAVAISPDGRNVAVGGFTSAEGAKDFPVYIFDRENGTIRAKLSGLPEVTHHLAYSKDGRFLAASLHGSNGIRIYETVSYFGVAQDTDYGGDSYGLEFDKSGRLVSASFDGFVRLYSSDFHLVRKEKPPKGKHPFSGRFSPNGQLIAVGFEDTATLDVLSSSDLSFQYSLQPAEANGSLSPSWSADGQTLCAAGQYTVGVDKVVPVVCWSDAGKGTLSTFSVAGSTVMDMRALRDGGIALAVYDGTVEVLGPNGKIQWRATPEFADYRGGPAFPRLSLDGDRIEVREYSFDGAEWTNHTLRFSVTERKLETDPKDDSSLSSPITGTLAVTGWEGGYTPTLNGHALPIEAGERCENLAIAPNQESLVLGADFHIYKFDNQGKQVWTTPSDIAFGVNVTRDQRFVVAALGDGTVRWYTFDKGEEVLAVFVDRDLKRWVAWNPDGFFAFEGAGDALIGYQINRGPSQAGDFVKVDQLRDIFYRPDLISQILKPGGAEAVVAARERIGDISKVLSGGLPPEIELVSVAQTDEPDRYLVQFRIKDMGGGHGRIVYRIDGIEIEARDAVDIKGTGSDTISRYITVGSGQHTLTIAGRTSNNKIEGTPRTAQLTGRQPVAGSKTALYVIAAGISHYSDHSLDEGVKFAAADAELVAARFQEQEGKGLYQKVKTVALSDSKATAENIRTEVAHATAAIHPGDTFVLYLAGHGIAVEGEYYFIPWEAEYTNQNDLLAKSLNREAIQGLLKQIHTNKSVLILDTCGAGAFLEARATAVSEKAAIEKVAMMSGRAVIAASNSEQMAMDGYQNHGVFTYALLRGLQAADSDAQGEILITRLAEYVQSQVPSITLEKWHYKQTPLSRIEGEPFPIAHKAAN